MTVQKTPDMLFYYLSGSPFSWKIWLALEHKNIPYTLRVLRKDRGDLQSSEFTAINPHGRAPAIVHRGFSLYESTPIVEYLEDALPTPQRALWPIEVQEKARARRLTSEIDSIFYPSVRRIVEAVTGGQDKNRLKKTVESAKRFLEVLKRPDAYRFLAGDTATVADYSLYPLTAMIYRIASKRPQWQLRDIFPVWISSWRGRIEALPYFDNTIPPHWKQGETQ